MKHEFLELTHQDLARVSGGFLPLLGLIGAGSGIAGQILGGIGKKKAQQAEQIMSETGAGQGAAPTTNPQGAAATPPAGAGTRRAQPVPVAPRGGCTCR